MVRAVPAVRTVPILSEHIRSQQPRASAEPCDQYRVQRCCQVDLCAAPCCCEQLWTWHAHEGLNRCAGCAAAWQRLRDLQPGLVPPRALAGVAAIKRMLRDFPLDNPQVNKEISYQKFKSYSK